MEKDELDEEFHGAIGCDVLTRDVTLPFLLTCSRTH